VAGHPLDNPIWEALRTHHAPFARRDGAAIRHVADDRIGFVERTGIGYWLVRRHAAEGN